MENNPTLLVVYIVYEINPLEPKLENRASSKKNLLIFLTEISPISFYWCNKHAKETWKK